VGTVTGTVTDAAATMKSAQHWVSRPLIAGSSDGPEGSSGILTQLVSVLNLMLGTLGQVPGPPPGTDGCGAGPVAIDEHRLRR
jgi:hypothetical protein